MDEAYSCTHAFIANIFAKLFTFIFFGLFLILNDERGGRGSYVPTAQEIARHFSQDYARVLKLLDFFKIDVPV